MDYKKFKKIIREELNLLLENIACDTRNNNPYTGVSSTCPAVQGQGSQTCTANFPPGPTGFEGTCGPSGGMTGTTGTPITNVSPKDITKGFEKKPPRDLQKLQKAIKREVQDIQENKIVKKYDIPPEIKDALENKLKMNPLIRFVKNLKAVNSIPPSYRIFLLNGQHFDLYYESFSLMAKIGIDEYYLADLEERNYAVKHINRLMTEPIIKTGEDETADVGTTDTPTPPPSPEPEEPAEEPEA